MAEIAIRDRIACAVESQDWAEITDTDHPFVARVQFCTAKQVEDMNGHDYPPEPELQTQHPDDSDERCEDLFILSVIHGLKYAIRHGYLETLSEAQRAAILAHARVDMT